LSHAVVGNLTKIGEGGFGGDGTEARVCVERLKELSCAHGFAESEDAVGMILRVEKLEPLVDVVALEESVGGEWAAAGAVGTGVGEQDSESMGEKELCVSGHADAVVGEAVKEEDGVSVGVIGSNEPGAECRLICCRDGDIGEVGVESDGGTAHRCDFFVAEWASCGVEGSVGYEDAHDCAEGTVEDQGEDEAADSAG